MLVHYTFIFIYDLPYSIPDRNNFYSNRMRRMCSCHGKYKISLPLVYIQIYKVDKSILTNQNSFLYYCCIGHVQGIQKIIYVHWTWHKSNLKAEKWCFLLDSKLIGRNLNVLRRSRWYCFFIYFTSLQRMSLSSNMSHNETSDFY